MFFNFASDPSDGTMGLQNTWSTGFDDFSNSSNTGIDWNGIINRGFGLASQIFARGGRYQTQQTGPDGNPIGQGYSPAATLSAQAQAQQAWLQQQQLLQANSQYNRGGGANSLDGIASSLVNTISNNPLIFAALGVGAYLLFREPPKSRR